MKSTIFSVALLVASVAVATPVNVTSKACLAVMPVASKQAEVIIAVPWVEPGASSTNCISVTNFVLAANLTAHNTEGDTLTWYDSSGVAHGWMLKASKQWTAVSGRAAISADLPVIKQGQALILSRHSPTNTDGTAKTFYLVGQVSTNATVKTTVVRASNSNTPTFTLVAPPITAESIDLNGADVTASSFSEGDRIYLGVSSGVRAYYEYDGTKWAPNWNPSASAVVYRGQGFWYSRKATTDLTITWNSVPYVSY